MARSKIIFDNDGVNIDSEDLAMRVMDDEGVKMVKRFKPDAEIPKDYIYSNYAGTSTDVIVVKLMDKFGIDPVAVGKDYGMKPHDAMDKAKVGEFVGDLITLETNRVFSKGLKSIPGATKSLEEIHALFGAENVALATTSRKDRMDVSLQWASDPQSGANARLAEFFPEGARRRSGYGHPNKYDEAFGALAGQGFTPKNSIIVEDSISGVTKAKAGRPEVAVIGTVAAKFYEKKDDQAAKLLDQGANLVITDFRDLSKAAKWLQADMDAKAKPDFVGHVYHLPASVAKPSAGFKPQPAG